MAKVALWWDMDSCPLPSHMDPFVVRSMTNILLEKFKIRGSGIGHQFRAYKYPSAKAKEEDIELGQIMFNSGIHLQLVLPGNTNEIEKIIMADMLLWAMDVPPPGNIIFIVGNVDFSYVFHKLRERSYNVFLVCASIIQMPRDMLSVANEYLEWLTFLQMLDQNEAKLQFPSNVYGRGPEHYQSLSNAYTRSASTVSSKEWEEYQNRSSFSYIPEDSLTGQLSFNNERDSRQFSIPSLNEAPTVMLQQPRGPGFHRHATKSTEKSMDPTGNKHRPWKPPILTGPKKKLASMDEFRSWLRQVVNSKESENGYNISPIRKDFEKATGNILDFTFLGFPKIMNLLEQCKDIAEVKEVKKGCHLAFPVETKRQNPFETKKINPKPEPMKGKPENSPSGVNPNPNLQAHLKPNSNPKPKPESEAEQKSMPKASEGDFYAFLLHMVSMGELSQGFLMSQLRKKFESFSGKCLDIQHLGYQKLTNLVEVYGDLVSVDKTGGGPPRLYPAGFVREVIPNSNLSRTSEEISVNMVNHVSKQEAKLEVNYFSTAGSDQSPENKTWKDNLSLEKLSYQNSELAITENEWPSMGLNTLPLMGFQEYNNKSDSSSTPQGSQVSEWDDQFSNMVNNLSLHANSHQLEGSEYINQSLSSLPSEGNIPTRNAAHAEALQNMKENKSVCKVVTRVSETADSQDSSCSMSFGRELPNCVSSQLEPTCMELKVSSNILVSPLQSLPEESVVSTESLQDTRLDYKQSEQNAKGVVNEETNVHTIVSPAEAIMQVAGRGLKSICDFSMWKKSQ